MTKVKTILFTIWGLNLGNGWDEHYQKNRSMILKYHHEKGYPQVSQLSTDLTSGPDSGSLKKTCISDSQSVSRGFAGTGMPSCRAREAETSL